MLSLLIPRLCHYSVKSGIWWCFHLYNKNVYDINIYDFAECIVSAGMTCVSDFTLKIKELLSVKVEATDDTAVIEASKKICL